MRLLRLLLAAAVPFASASPLFAQAREVSATSGVSIPTLPSLSLSAVSAAQTPSLSVPSPSSLSLGSAGPVAQIPALPTSAAVKLETAQLAQPASLKAAVEAARAAATTNPSKSDDARPAAVAQANTAAVNASVYDAAAAPSSYAQPVIAQPFEEPALPQGVRLDRRPRPPQEGAVRTRRFHLSRDDTSEDGAQAIVLDADPKDPASIEKALLELVDSAPQTFGASSKDMGKVHVRLVPGSKEQGQADTYFAVFRQWKQGQDHDGKPYHLMVDGGSLTFVIKVLEGKPLLMAIEGRLYPGVTSDIMTVNYSDDELSAIAEKRLAAPVRSSMSKVRRKMGEIWSRVTRKARGEDGKPQLLTREIVNVEGSWRALNLYQAADLKGRPVVVAVDVKSGDAFAWSAQDLLRSAPAGTERVSGVALARGNALSKEGNDHGPMTALPLPYANVYDQSGKAVAVTDADGKFTVAGAAGTGPMKLTVRLEGSFAKLSDDDEKNPPIEATVLAQPGSPARLVLNQDGGVAVEPASDVNGYVYYSQQVAWLRDAAGIDDPRILAPLLGGVRANRTDMPGNAYYDPATDSLNLQAEAIVKGKRKNGQPISLHFENTAQPSIIFHESTHRAVQILSQLALTAEQAASRAFRFVTRVVEPVMDGGVNEAIADTVSMFMRGSPMIGDGFIIDPPKGAPSFIRTGENTTQLDPKNPDPHAQGEAFMGFTWTVRQGLVDALGKAAGAAYAATLIVPTTLFGQPKDVPTAMLHVLLASMRADGSMPHEALIRKAAADHGVELPAPPTRPNS